MPSSSIRADGKETSLHRPMGVRLCTRRSQLYREVSVLFLLTTNDGIKVLEGVAQRPFREVPTQSCGKRKEALD